MAAVRGMYVFAALAGSDLLLSGFLGPPAFVVPFW
jgi:hypothetical protein